MPCVSRTGAKNPRQPGQLAAPYVPLTTEDKFKYRFFEIAGPRGLALLNLLYEFVPSSRSK